MDVLLRISLGSCTMKLGCSGNQVSILGLFRVVGLGHEVFNFKGRFSKCAGFRREHVFLFAANAWLGLNPLRKHCATTISYEKPYPESPIPLN